MNIKEASAIGTAVEISRKHRRGGGPAVVIHDAWPEVTDFANRMGAGEWQWLENQVKDVCLAPFVCQI